MEQTRAARGDRCSGGMADELRLVADGGCSCTRKVDRAGYRLMFKLLSRGVEVSLERSAPERLDIGLRGGLDAHSSPGLKEAL